jgi:hypothetical protein
MISRVSSTARVSDQAAASAADRQRSLPRAADGLAIGLLVAEAAVIEYFLRHLLSRPFYYDEAWRGWTIAQGFGFLGHLKTAVGPLALGYLAIENLARIALGDNETALRTPMFLVLPVLGVATYLLARRWLGTVVSFCVAALLLVNLWIVNYGLQLKSYSYEALFAVITIGLYLLLRRPAWRGWQLLGLSAALGLTCVFSVPNLFVAGPLLVLDFVETVRARQRLRLRITGEVLAGVIALAHLKFFLSPQGAVAGTNYFATQYAPHGIGPFVRFAFDGLTSYVPSVITGVAGANNAVPAYRLPPLEHHVLAVGLAILLVAGIVAAVRDAAGRALIVAVGGALVLELFASALHEWPFGLIRQNIFVFPLLYILGGMGGVWLARALRGPRRSQAGTPIPLAAWRGMAMVVAVALLVATVAAGGLTTAKTFVQSSQLQNKPAEFSGVKAAVADARRTAAPGDLVIIRADRFTPAWYGVAWVYYMDQYTGWPAALARRPGVPEDDTISVIYVTPGAVRSFLAAHPGSKTIFLLEFIIPGNTFPPSLHLQSLHTLRQFGYCPVANSSYAVTGQLTTLNKC